MSPAARPDLSVVTSAHDVADARLHRIVDAAGRAGLGVEVLARGDAGDAPASAVFRPLTARAGVIGRVLRLVAALGGARGRCVLVLDPDLAVAGSAWRRLTRRPLVVDVHEDYLAVAEDRAWATGPRKRAARVLARTATRCAARADLTVTADEHVPPLTAADRLVVRNEPQAGEIRPSATRDPHPRAVYVGDVRASRGFRAMVEAVTAAPPWELDVVGPVGAPDLAWFEQRSRGGGTSRVRLHGRLPPARSWAVAAGAWAGLALLEDTPAFREAVPTKLYEYLAAGLAVVVTPLPRMRALVEQSGAGVVATGFDRVAGDVSTTLLTWLEQPDLLDAHRTRALAWSHAQHRDRSSFDALAARLRALVQTDDRSP